MPFQKLYWRGTRPSCPPCSAPLDTTLVCSGADPVTTTSVMNQQLAIDFIHDWLVEHRMQSNVQKSHVMWF